MRQRRVSGLGEPCEPFLVPGIEPVMSVVRSEKDVEVRIERTAGKLHQQQWTMNRQGHQDNRHERNWTRVPFGLDHLNAHSCTSSSPTWIQKGISGFALICPGVISSAEVNLHGQAGI